MPASPARPAGTPASKSCLPADATVPPVREIEIRGHTIRLGQLLKMAGIVGSGGEAKALLSDGAVSVNGAIVKKPNQTVRVGDVVVVEQRGWQRTVQVLRLHKLANLMLRYCPLVKRLPGSNIVYRASSLESIPLAVEMFEKGLTYDRAFLQSLLDGLTAKLRSGVHSQRLPRIRSKWEP